MTGVGLLLVGLGVLVFRRRHVIDDRPASRSAFANKHAVRFGRHRPAGVDARSLSLCLDLIAAALRSGLPPDAAIRAVSSAAADPSLMRQTLAPLDRVARLIAWGAEPSDAWRTAQQVPGYERVAVAGARCATSGAKLAGALTTTAGQLRADRQTNALAAAARVGIWSLLPLGACFLPAFVCLGIVPTTIGLAGQLVLSGYR